MMKFLPIHTIPEIRAIEDAVFASGIDEYSLMQIAGQQAYDIIKKEYAEVSDLTIFCGKGNNAGDGYVIAKLALRDGLKVKLVELFENDSDTALKAYSDIPDAIQKDKFNADLKIESDSLVIDAIFGIGFTGGLQGEALQAVEYINNLTNKIVALDCPSGLNIVDGKVGTVAAKADITITFIAHKLGLYLGEGKIYSGRVFLAGLNISSEILERFSNNHQKLDVSNVKDLLPIRRENTNKGSFGNVLIIGGFANMPGAIVLAAEACMRVGAGRVTILTERENFQIIIKSLPEAIVADIADYEVSFLESFDVIAIGPGLGTGEAAQGILKQIAPLDVVKVIDADALNILSNNSQIKLENAIITPHPKEASRLLKQGVDKVQENRFEAVRALSEQYHATAVLKGSCSLIKYHMNDIIYFCPYGNSGLAKAGSGDVLTGIITGLLAQKRDMEHIVADAVALHAICADKLLATQSKHSIIPSDLIKWLKEI